MDQARNLISFSRRVTNLRMHKGGRLVALVNFKVRPHVASVTYRICR